MPVSGTGLAQLMPTHHCFSDSSLLHLGFSQNAAQFTPTKHQVIRPFETNWDAVRAIHSNSPSTTESVGNCVGGRLGAIATDRYSPQVERPLATPLSRPDVC